MKRIDIPRDRLLVAKMRLDAGETYPQIADSMEVTVCVLRNALKREGLFVGQKGKYRDRRTGAIRTDDTASGWDIKAHARALSMPLRVSP